MSKYIPPNSELGKLQTILKNKNINIRELSRLTGINHNTLYSAFIDERRGNFIPASWRDKVFSVLSITQADVSSDVDLEDNAPTYKVKAVDNTVNDKSIVYVQEKDIVFGLGSSGYPSFEDINNSTPIPYPLSYFNSIRVNPDKCIVIKAEGDSMYPFIDNKDKLLIELTDLKENGIIKDNAIYALVTRSGLRVKCLRKNIATQSLIIHSYNPAYQDEILEKEQVDAEVFHIYKVLRIERELI